VYLREARGDWTFPKGKLDEGETFEQAALREVAEETGMNCHVLRFVGTTNYTHRKGKPKIVAYYLMGVNDGEFAPNAPKSTSWCGCPWNKCARTLTWDRDQELFDPRRRVARTARHRELADTL